MTGVRHGVEDRVTHSWLMLMLNAHRWGTSDPSVIVTHSLNSPVIEVSLTHLIEAVRLLPTRVPFDSVAVASLASQTCWTAHSLISNSYFYS